MADTHSRHQVARMNMEQRFHSTEAVLRYVRLPCFNAWNQIRVWRNLAQSRLTLIEFDKMDIWRKRNEYTT
jgi:hypothetical protein